MQEQTSGVAARTGRARPARSCASSDAAASDPSYRIDDGRRALARRADAGGAGHAADRPGRDGRGARERVGRGCRVGARVGPGAARAPTTTSSGFDPIHPLVADAWRRRPHARFGRSGLVMQTLIPSIIEQKVTGQEAFAGYRALVHRYGERAPGPGDGAQALGAARRRDRADDPAAGRGWSCTSTRPAHAPIVTATRVAEALERHDGPEDLDRRLRSLPGIGVWTSAEVRSTALGDPDAVSFGDYHVAKDIGWAMTGTPFTDAELAEFLEPWRPQRNRAVDADPRDRRRPAASRPADVAAHAPARTHARESVEQSSEQGSQGRQDVLGELAVQVARLPLAERSARGSWTRRGGRSPPARRPSTRRSPRR